MAFCLLAAPDHMTDQTRPHAPGLIRTGGFWAVIPGAMAHALSLVLIAGPSFETRHSAAQQMVETTGDIWRSLLGLPRPAPQINAVRVRTYVTLAAPVLGIAAVVLSAISGALRKHAHYLGRDYVSAIVVDCSAGWWRAVASRQH